MKYIALNLFSPFPKFTIGWEVFVRMMYVFNLIQIGSTASSKLLSILCPL